MLIIEKIFLVGSRMLTFIDHRLQKQVIKQVYNKFMGGLYIIMTSDFYLALLIQDSWISKLKIDGFDFFSYKFWYEHVTCYELNQVMQQNDIKFVDILVFFWITSQNFKDINFINKICLKTPPTTNMLPHLFYIDVKTIEHNKIIFQNTTIGECLHFSTRYILTHVFISNYQWYQIKQ